MVWQIYGKFPSPNVESRCRRFLPAEFLQVWQYRDADPHFGSWQAKELSSHLKDRLYIFEGQTKTAKICESCRVFVAIDLRKMICLNWRC